MLLGLYSRQRALFFVLRLTSSLFPLRTYRRKTCRTRRTPRLLPCPYYKPFLCAMSLSFCICRRTSDNDDCGIAPPVFCHAFATSLFFTPRPLSSFCICRRISDNDDCGIAPFFFHAFAASLFFILRLASTLYPLQALRCKTCRTRRTSRLLPCLARWCFILRMRSACFPPRGDDITPAVCPYLISALNGSSQHCFRYRHARRAFFPFMRRLPLL